ncbi:MAG: ribosome maturation factor RimP [Gammaproteobacteria bacterium TMED95]|jgi:ribosome maturation factor RimP|nr:ribosome maturation factor RimP [Gammaproteobacteria bacterium]OUV20311.1 MAG: ribosome maturation factor RimP [Gammaproteobacteria bacterium TMED95]|tara:strand:- start:660 stop:1106 length:447 start_codon:yes stop_codon:yes gene_type:complete
MSDETLNALIEPVVIGLGYQLWGIEKVQQGRRVTLKIYIDAKDGVTIEDCAKVSRQVSGLLDVEDPISGDYLLEVSSPGIDRRLFKPEHFDLCKGEKIQVTLRQAFEGQRKWKGVLCGLDEGDAVLRVDDTQEIVLPLASIERARVLM